MYDDNLKMNILARRKMARTKGRIPDEFIWVNNTIKKDELFYDEFSDTYYWSNRVAVLAAESAINRDLHESGMVYLSTYYDMIHHYSVPRVYLDYYWSLEDTNWIDFDHVFVDAENTPDGKYDCHMIVFIPLPERRHNG